MVVDPFKRSLFPDRLINPLASANTTLSGPTCEQLSVIFHPHISPTGNAVEKEHGAILPILPSVGAQLRSNSIFWEQRHRKGKALLSMDPVLCYMILFNIWGAPGSGKSTAAAALFVAFKKAHRHVELVGEQAREHMYSQSTCQLEDNQFMVSALQFERVKRLERFGVEVAIAECPFQQGSLYDEHLVYHDELKALLKKCAEYYSLNGHGTYNIFVRRAFEYRAGERRETEEQAAAFIPKICDILGQPFNVEIDGNDEGVGFLTDWAVNTIMPSWDALRTKATE